MNDNTYAMTSFWRLESLKDWFVDLASKMNHDEVNAPLGEGEWSLAQVVEHLLIVERAIMVSLARSKAQMPPHTAETSRQKQLYQAMLASGQKYEVPSPAVEPTANPDINTLRADWEKLRRKMQSKIENGDLPGTEILIFDHPIGGPMNADEAIDFLGDHLIYHQLRVQNLLAQASERATPAK